MADTLGGVIDKLCTVDLKIGHQKVLNEINDMSLDDFKEKYWGDDSSPEVIWNLLRKCGDLSVQKEQLIKEIDDKVIEMIKVAKAGADLDDGKFIQRSHKSY